MAKVDLQLTFDGISLHLYVSSGKFFAYANNAYKEEISRTEMTSLRVFRPQFLEFLSSLRMSPTHVDQCLAMLEAIVTVCSTDTEHMDLIKRGKSKRMLKPVYGIGPTGEMILISPAREQV